LTHTEHRNPVQVSQAYKSPSGLIVATIEIPLTRGYVTRIYEADQVFTHGRRWAASVRPDGKVVYAIGRTGGEAVYLHNLLAPDWEFVDHADGDGLNNCRHNLRDGSGFRNNANKRMSRNNTSGYKGVSWDKRKSKWRASIRGDGRPIFLGNFGTPEEAAHAYDEAAIRYFGEYAMTNAMLAVAAVIPDSRQHHPVVEQTRCRRAGHEYTPENTYINPAGKRECRECRKIRATENNPKRRVPNPRPGGRFCPPGCTCKRHSRGGNRRREQAG
jgi:AP2 domain-containing protein